MKKEDTTAVQTQREEQDPAPSDPNALEAGEKVFAIILLILGAAAFGLSLELWLRMKEPRIASAAAMPLFVSGLWTLLALLTVIENMKLTTPLSAVRSWKEKLWGGLSYAMPRNVVVILCAILAYCVALKLGISFYIATPLFLYGTMCYLIRKNYLKNILWTVIVMAFVVIVFRMLFNVIFP